MKIKFIILILILSFCTNEDSTSEVIQVTDIQMKELLNLESNKETELDTTFLICLLYTSPSPRDLSTSRMPSSA